MENIQVSNNSKVKMNYWISHMVGDQRRIILAFPGMGKTPYCRKHGGYQDMDFGFFRTACGVKKENEFKLYRAFAKYIQVTQSQSGFYCFTNEPGLLKFLPPEKCVMFLPASRQSATFNAMKMGVDLETVWEWIQGWERTAISCGIPVCRTDIALDKLLALEPNQHYNHSLVWWKLK